MKKLLLILTLLVMFSSASALTSIGTFKVNECVNLIQTCDNCSYINLSAVQTPDSTIYLLNDQMQQTGNFYNHSFCNTSQLGTYIVNGYGDLDGSLGVWSYTFTLTNNGLEPAGDIFEVMIYIMFILSCLGLLYTLFIGLAKIVTFDTTVYNVLMSWGFFILLIITYFLSKGFLIDPFIQNLSGLFLQITAWSNVVLPIIAFIMAIIKKSFDKKRPPTVQEINGRILSYG